jgi:hypothetical protein
MNKIFLFPMLFLSLVLCTHCKKRTPIEPCADFDAQKPYATIKKGWSEVTKIEVDTILASVSNGNGVVFSTTAPYDSYHWTIGTDDRTWNTPTVFLRFSSGSGNINITMIGKRKPNPCNPKDTGIDTLRSKLFLKVWNLLSPPEPYIYEGTWSGYFTNEPDKKFDVFIKNWPKTDTWNDWDGVRIHNLPQGCGCKNGLPDNIIYSLEMNQTTYKAFRLQGSGNSNEGCFGMVGTAFLDRFNNNKITIETSFNRTFVGIRKP